MIRDVLGKLSLLYNKEEHANWRSDGFNAWSCGLPGFHCSIMNILNKVAFIVSKAESGGWNDLDMLEVGNGAMTDTEYVSHFSMCKSPLATACEAKKLTETSQGLRSSLL